MDDRNNEKCLWIVSCHRKYPFLDPCVSPPPLPMYRFLWIMGADILFMVSEPDGHFDIIPLLDTLEVQLTHLMASMC